MDIQLPQILFQIINFGVVAGALTYFLYAPVKKVLDERAAKIEEAQKAAEITIAGKHQIEEMKKKIKKDAEKEASKIIEEAVQAAQSRKKEITTEERNKVKADFTKKMEEWENEKRAYIEDIKKSFADSVVMTAEKVIQESLDKKAHTKLIDMELDQLLKAV